MGNKVGARRKKVGKGKEEALKRTVSKGSSKNQVRKIKSLGSSLPQFIPEVRCYCELFRERQSAGGMEL
jgi:hypothetical protein